MVSTMSGEVNVLSGLRLYLWLAVKVLLVWQFIFLWRCLIWADIKCRSLLISLFVTLKCLHGRSSVLFLMLSWESTLLGKKVTWRGALTTYFLSTDVQHNSDIPWWPRGTVGAGLHPWQQDPLPDLTWHVKERSHVKEYEEQEPGFWCREGQSSYSQSTRWGGGVFLDQNPFMLTSHRCFQSLFWTGLLLSGHLLPLRPLITCLCFCGFFYGFMCWLTWLQAQKKP